MFQELICMWISGHCPGKHSFMYLQLNYWNDKSLCGQEGLVMMDCGSLLRRDPAVPARNLFPCWVARTNSIVDVTILVGRTAHCIQPRWCSVGALSQCILRCLHNLSQLPGLQYQLRPADLVSEGHLGTCVLICSLGDFKFEGESPSEWHTGSFCGGNECSSCNNNSQPPPPAPALSLVRWPFFSFVPNRAPPHGHCPLLFSAFSVRHCDTSFFLKELVFWCCGQCVSACWHSTTVAATWWVPGPLV